MMGMIWGGMMVAAFFFGAIKRTPEAVAEAVLSGAENAVTLALGLLGMMCFWSGLLEIAKRSGLTEKLAILLKPFMKVLFPRLSPNSPAVLSMVMNITANLLGLSNAATPLGLAAMAELDKINPEKGIASDEMCMFVVINTASVTLIPTTVMILRQRAGSSEPFNILIPVWICSLTAITVGILAAKIMARYSRRGRR